MTFEEWYEKNNRKLYWLREKERARVVWNNAIIQFAKLREASARMLTAIETLGSLRTINTELDFSEWRDCMEPIITDAHKELQDALNACPNA